jgi:predicted secreted protein
MVKPRDMAKPLRKLAIVTLATITVLLGLASTALAASWSDIDNATLEPYGISLDQVALVSTGYPDGSWRPWQSITRAQFVKMANAAFSVGPANPGSPTFSDVPSTDQFYQYIEGAYLAGLVNGVAAGEFGPNATITREQAAAIAVRKVAVDRGIDLNDMKEADITEALSDFQDAASVSEDLRAEVAFAINQGFIKGDAAGSLRPKGTMTRVAAAALLIRAMGPSPQELGADDDGSTITLAVGDTIKVVLEGNPTTGYGWTAALTPADSGIIQQVGEPTYVPDSVPSGIVGAGGTYTFTFKALAVGQVSLKLAYARPWESVPPLQTFAVTVNVKNAPLEGTGWKLEGWSISSLYPADFNITVEFQGGQISGRAAVNTYSGSYAIGPNGGLVLWGLARTAMLPGTEQATRAESDYFDLLGQARAYRLGDGELTLLDANGNELLIFGES